jgi:hypothetical protein
MFSGVYLKSRKWAFCLPPIAGKNSAFLGGGFIRLEVCMKGENSSLSLAFIIDLDLGEGVTLLISELTLSGDPAISSMILLKRLLAILRGESKFFPLFEAGSIFWDGSLISGFKIKFELVSLLDLNSD